LKIGDDWPPEKLQDNVAIEANFKLEVEFGETSIIEHSVQIPVCFFWHLDSFCHLFLVLVRLFWDL
jgi:hypothetical protein